MSSLEPYMPILNAALLFVDGLLFGLAVKKALTSVVLFSAGIALAAYLGISVVSVSLPDLLARASQLSGTLYGRLGPVLVSFPILFILGVLIGLWKG